MEMVFEFLQKINIAELICIGIMFWFFYSRLDRKIEKLDEKLDSKIEKLDEKLTARIDKLDEKITDIDRRVCRVEGILTNKECCMIKDESKMKKAE